MLDECVRVTLIVGGGSKLTRGVEQLAVRIPSIPNRWSIRTLGDPFPIAVLAVSTSMEWYNMRL